MLHFEFRIQLENQSSSLIPAQKAVTTRLCRMSDENGDNSQTNKTTATQDGLRIHHVKSEYNDMSNYLWQELTI